MKSIIDTIKVNDMVGTCIQNGSKLVKKDMKVSVRQLLATAKTTAIQVKSKTYDEMKERIADALTIGFAISCKYDEVGDFYEGRAKVSVAGRWGFVDEAGREVVPLDYDEVGDFSNGMVKVKLNEKWGYVNKNGKVEVGCNYSEASNFKNEYARVRITERKPGPDINSGVVDKSGKFTRILLHEDYEKYFNRNFLYRLKKIFGLLSKNRYIHKVTNTNYESAYHYGWKWVSNSLNFGFVHKNGKRKIPLQYDGAWDFNEGLALVKLKDKYGYINTKGERVIPIQYDGAAVKFSDGAARVKLNNEGWKFVDKKNKQITPFKFDSAKNFSQGIAAVFIENSWGYINKQKIVIPFLFDDCRSFREGFAGVKLSDKWGFLCVPRKQSWFSQLKKIMLNPYWHSNLSKEELQAVKLESEKIDFNIETVKDLVLGHVLDILHANDKNTVIEPFNCETYLHLQMDGVEILTINQDDCIQYLQLHGATELVGSMRRHASGNGKSTFELYQNWYDWLTKGQTSIEFTTKSQAVRDFDKLKNGSFEVFHFLYKVSHGVC